MHHQHRPPDTHPTPLDQPIEPTTITVAEREHMVWVPDNGAGFIAMPRSVAIAQGYLTPPTPGPITTQPQAPAGIDPRAQILAAGGIGAGAAGWGAGQLLSAVAGLGAAGLVAIALLILAARMPRTATTGKSSGGDVTFQRGSRVKARHIHIH